MSECGVIAIWLHHACTTTMVIFVLHVSPLCEYCLGASLAETNQSAGCNFPYETRGMLDICDGILEVFSLACDASRTPSLAAPPLGGPGPFTITALWLRLTDMVTTLSMEAL